MSRIVSLIILLLVAFISYGHGYVGYNYDSQKGVDNTVGSIIVGTFLVFMLYIGRKYILKWMRMSREAYFIPHCDDEYCTLGTLEFDCPCCGKHNVNYDNYYDDDKLYKGEIVELNCEHCEEPLTIELIEHDNIVKPKQR